ncbi:MAG: peptide-methionine (S)-S-oxide reductase MsrA [Terriglobales bacterium]
MEKAIFALGCFWGSEAAFRAVPGVAEVASGYTGGHMANPTYREVCGDQTGHAEAVEVVYDPAQVSYRDLLQVFWDNHDPTTVNRQGPDVGTQYRSAIFYLTPEQAVAARESKTVLEAGGTLKRPVVTEITAAGPFHRAEEYHQRYLEKHGMVACHVPSRQ